MGGALLIGVGVVGKRADKGACEASKGASGDRVTSGKGGKTTGGSTGRRAIVVWKRRCSRNVTFHEITR